ncbi:MAG: DUF992 domain-containing protein [Hyphomicrobium sp.]
MSKFTSLAVVAATLAAVSTSATRPATAADAQIVAGTLTCKGGGSVGLIVGSKQDFTCVFNLAGPGGREGYVGTITKIGLDVGVTGESVLVWSVLSSTSKLPPNALVGDYAGVSAEAAVGIGAGANALIGGSNKSVVLQPISVEGQTGLNIAIGVAELSLRRG